MNIESLKKNLNYIRAEADTLALEFRLHSKTIHDDYKVKNDRMKKLHHKVINLLKGYSTWTIQHVMRDKNVIADKLSKDGRNKRS